MLLLSVLVTPWAGVWIEIACIRLNIMKMESLPGRECGLKYSLFHCPSDVLLVTPWAGVWIEILDATKFDKSEAVTPWAGVWIEMNLVGTFNSRITMSLPGRECGLKYRNFLLMIKFLQSLPGRECGLKYFLQC